MLSHVVAVLNIKIINVYWFGFIEEINTVVYY